jgi:hypothetical protein
VAFDTAAARARVLAVAPDDSAALAAVGRVHRAFALAFTDAVTLLFKAGIGLVMLGFLITVLMPNVELRHSVDKPAPAPRE